jgi:DDE family transposase
MRSKRSRVHPPFKTKYRVTNWPTYDRALADRGPLILWISPEAIKTWNAKAIGKRGGQAKSSDLAIETAMTLRLLFHLTFRRTEGFMRSVFHLTDLDLEVPDHTTLSRRARHLNVKLKRPLIVGPVVLAIDSSGLRIVGQGQWAAEKHGKRGMSAWRKIHIGVDQAGFIVAQELTDSGGDDGRTGVELIERVPQEVSTVIGDRAYDSRAIYVAARKRDAKGRWCTNPTPRTGPRSIASASPPELHHVQALARPPSLQDEVPGAKLGGVRERPRRARLADLLDLPRRDPGVGGEPHGPPRCSAPLLRPRHRDPC